MVLTEKIREHRPKLGIHPGLICHDQETSSGWARQSPTHINDPCHIRLWSLFLTLCDCLTNELNITTYFWSFLAHFDPIRTLIFLFLGQKKMTPLISRGKNFGCVFFDAFRKSEQESEKIVTIGAFLAEIPN